MVDFTPIVEPRRIGDPGRRRVGDDLSPYFELSVGIRDEETRLQTDIVQFIESVEFEHALDMASLLQLKLHNPGLMQDPDRRDPLLPPDWGGYKAFQPGNEISLSIGYGMGVPRFIGRAIAVKHLPDFPDGDSLPSLTIKGYDKSYQMMDASGNITGGANNTVRLRVVEPRDDNDDQGQTFQGVLHSDIIKVLANQYDMDADVDDTTRAEDFTLKKGMKHYELIRGLANINDKDFWVDFDNTRRRWVLHWKEPVRDQRPEFTFVYGRGDASTLLSFQPEYGLREAVNEAVVLVFDRERQQWISIIEIEDFESTDPHFTQGGGAQARGTPSRRGRSGRASAQATAQTRQAANEIREGLDNASAFRLAAGGTAIDVIPTERFTDPEAAARFVQRWFLERRDHFIVGKGEVIGVETLRSKQVHKLEGIGVRLSGDYQFTSVRHKLGSDGLYKCEFIAHKQLVG